MRVALGSALLAAVLLMPAVYAQTPLEAPPAERPTYEIGDRWFRTDGAYDLAWAFDPPARLEWPLQVGKRGRAPGQWKGPHAPDGIPGHGIFTYYLVEGLEGAAADREGVVTVQDLYKYVEQQVTQKSMAVGGNQHLVMKGEFEGPLPLAKVKASK